MKKALIAIVVVLLLGGAGAAYYFFYMQQEQPELITEEPSVEPRIEEEQITKSIVDLQDLPAEITEYYVIERQLNVYNRPDQNAFVVDTLYKGEKVAVLEKSDGWYRISDYLAYKEGGEETAEWLDAKGLSDAEPVIQEQERLEILDGYLQKSDDLAVHLDIFRKMTQKLLDDSRCEPNDLVELGGWIRSVTYKERNVYFIYCGGLEQENKIYLDVDSGEIFYR